MAILNDDQWIRVEAIGGELQRLKPDQAARRLAEIEASGESLTILSFVRDWLSLPPVSPVLTRGECFGEKYVLEEFLAEGGMGVVWRARHTILQRDVALKVIHPALAAPGLEARFRREMESLTRLRHPGIVPIFDAGVHRTAAGAEIPFYVMELVEGRRLDIWAAEQRENRAVLVRAALEICEAVHHAHERGIVHRDLKPANVLVDRDGNPVILDFGIARLAGCPGELNGVGEAYFSGTPQYASPEQHVGRDGEFRSGESVDIYAVGVLLFEMLAGRRLYEFSPGTSVAVMRRTILEGPTVRLREVVEDCPDLLEEVINRALRRNPADRYYSMTTFRRALERALGELERAAVDLPQPWLPKPGAQIPGTNWTLEEKLGTGGAGEVWRGTQRSLGVTRVFKFCGDEEKARTLKRELTLYRLLKEQIGRNPHLVALHDLCVEEPPWYLMMEDVQATALPEWRVECGEGLSTETCVEIIAQTADVLHAAHEAGILHRDVKPGNILIRAVEGQRCPRVVHVYLTDFGIGQIVSEELLRTGTHLGFTQTLAPSGAFAGSFLYLAPEVLAGRSATARSDIYSLGVVLWQLLINSFATPLDPTHWREMIEDPLLQADLSRCLAGLPEDRWSSAAEFAASLRALQSRREAEEVRLAEMQRLQRAAYRNGVFRTAGVAFAILLSIVLLGWYALRKTREAAEHRQAAALGHSRATMAVLNGLMSARPGEARRQLFSRMPSVDVSDSESRAAFREIATALLAQPSFEPREETSSSGLADMGSVAILGDRMIHLKGDKSQPEVLNLAFPSGSGQALRSPRKRLAKLQVSSRGRVAGAVGDDGALYFWNGLDRFTDVAIDAQVVDGPVHQGAFAFSPTTLSRSRKMVAAVSRPSGVITVLFPEARGPEAQLWRKGTPAESAFPESSPASLLSFSHYPEGVLAAASAESNLLLLWQVTDEDSNLTGEFRGSLWHPDDICAVNWSPVGAELATGSADGVLRIWRYAPGLDPVIHPHRQIDVGGHVLDIAWSADGANIAVLANNGRVSICPAQWTNVSRIEHLHAEGARKVAFVGAHKLVAWSEATNRIWEVPEACFAERGGGGRDVTVAFHARGTLTVSGTEGVTFLQPGELAWSGGFKVSGSATAGWVGKRILFREGDAWKFAVGEERSAPERVLVRPLNGPALQGAVAASALGRRYASIDNGIARCWSRDERDEGITFRSERRVHALAVSDFAPTSAKADEMEVTIFDHVGGQEFRAPIQSVTGMTFSPTERLLICRTPDSLEVLDYSGAALNRQTIPFSSGGSGAVAFSPDGRFLALCGESHEVRIVTVRDRKMLRPDIAADLAEESPNRVVLRSPTPRRITSLAWHHGGAYLACGTADGFAQCWNLADLRRTLRKWHLDWSDVDLPPMTKAVPVTLY